MSSRLPQLQAIFKGLSNEDISGHCKSGMVCIKVGELANTTIHVAAKYYPWDIKPTYYAARSFYANCSFADLISTKKGVATYNQKNANKIMEFDSLPSLELFINQ